MAKTTYDYNKQAWVVDGRYASCNHPESMNCQCYGRLHAGEAYELKYFEYGLACDCCVTVIANGDYTGLSKREAERIRLALENIPHYLQVGDSHGYRALKCDICGEPAGNRYEVGYLE